MNAPIEALYATGVTLYAVLFAPDGTVWNGTVFEAYNSGHWGTYAVLLSEYSGSGYYRANYPIASPTVLTRDVIFAQAGVTPTLGDPPASNIYASQGYNIASIGQSVLSANNFGLSAGGMIQGAVIAGTLTPSSFSTNLTSSVDAAYQGRVLLFTGGPLINQVGNIISYVASSFVLSVGGPFTGAPGIGDPFLII